jgi:hypothetical protein
MGLLRADVDADIGRHLLREEGEVIVDVVRKHWVVHLWSVLYLALGCLSIYLAAIAPPSIASFPLVLGFGLWALAWWKARAAQLDRFVITNMRVFRMKGVFSRSTATMPLGRILDITVVKPLHGRILGFGHFTFESAAREQGLRDITYVGRPDERDLTIQRVVQRSGLRGPRVVN